MNNKKRLAIWAYFCLISITGSLLSNAQTAPQRPARTLVYGEDIQLTQDIDLTDSTRPLEQILDEALNGTGIEYRISNRHVMLFRPQSAIEPTQTYTLHGYVQDAKSQESLIGANLVLPALNQGVVTNAYGHFSITLPAGQNILQTSYVGYLSEATPIKLCSDSLIIIQLQPSETLQEVIVEADRPETGTSSSRTSAITVPIEQIKRTPALLGESDLLKALHIQPGVQPCLSGQASMSVRGGNPDQNLYMLDGMLLYNVDHLMGLESAFMPDAVKHVDFFRGSFSARYGGRLSSVTDARTKDGDMEHYHGNISIGLLSSHLSVEGPIVKDRTSFILSARRTYADFILRPIILSDETMYLDKFIFCFYDINAKINHRISDRDRLFFTFYNGRDVFGVGDRHTEVNNFYSNYNKIDIDLRWGNTLYHTRWNHIFTPQLFGNVTIGYNQFHMHTYNAEEYSSTLKKTGIVTSHDYYSSRFNSGIDDLSASIDLDFHYSHEHHIKSGVQYTLHQFRPDVQAGSFKYMIDDEEINSHYNIGNKHNIGNEIALYAEDDMTLPHNWQINAGARAVLYGTDGKCYPALEPRLAACRILPGGWRAKASYTIMHQYVHKLSTSPLSMPSDLWVSVTKNLKPMVANQWVIGTSFNRLNGWEFMAEAYWKEMNHLLEYTDGSTFAGSSRGWEDKVAAGRGRCYGIEFGINRTIGRTTGQINYTLAKSDRWFSDGSINGGRRFPYRYDRRHMVHCLIMHQLTKRVDINATWDYASGAMATIAQQQTQYVAPTYANYHVDRYYEDQDFDYYSGRNNYRMAPTHQLNIGINIHKQKKHGERIWNFSIMNAYNHKNQDLLYTEIEHKVLPYDGTSPIPSDAIIYTDPHNEHQVYYQTEHTVLKRITIIPILPSASYCYKF